LPAQATSVADDDNIDAAPGQGQRCKPDHAAATDQDTHLTFIIEPYAKRKGDIEGSMIIGPTRRKHCHNLVAVGLKHYYHAVAQRSRSRFWTLRVRHS
jgi:hypothetical protein